MRFCHHSPLYSFIYLIWNPGLHNRAPWSIPTFPDNQTKLESNLRLINSMGRWTIRTSPHSQSGVVQRVVASDVFSFKSIANDLVRIREGFLFQKLYKVPIRRNILNLFNFWYRLVFILVLVCIFHICMARML